MSTDCDALIFDMDGALIDSEPMHAEAKRSTEQLGLPPARCLVLEDSAHGIASARAAGCDVVGLPTSFAAAQLREARATYVVRDFAELTEALNLD